MSAFDFKNERARNLADPIHDKDAVNFRSARYLFRDFTGNTHVTGYYLNLTGGTGGPYTFTGTTNINSLSATSISANTILTGTISATTFYSGSTNLFDLIEIARTGDTTITAGTNIGVIATGSEPENYTINLNGDITLNSITATTLSSTTISATTFYSGSTDLSNIILAHDDRTRVQGGTNISTGGTANSPIINLDDNITLNSISATTISATTFYSGSTDLSDIIIAHDDITRIQGGINISTGGTANVPIINLNDDIKLNSISATTISATTFYSGSTNLFDLIEIARTGDTTVSSGTNINVAASGSTPENYTINLDDNITLSSVSATTISASIIFSGTTDLSTIIIAHDDRTRVQGGTNISTGGTANSPIINLDDNITLNSISANTMSATTFYSGSTDLSDIILAHDDRTRVQGGTNISTGGTANAPIVNLDDNITLSSISAATISATTFYSGSTSLYDIISSVNLNKIIEITGSTYILNESTNYSEITCHITTGSTITIDTDQLNNDSTIIFKVAGNYTITIQTEGSETIDGEDTQILYSYDSMNIYSYNSNWWIK